MLIEGHVYNNTFPLMDKQTFGLLDFANNYTHERVTIISYNKYCVISIRLFKSFSKAYRFPYLSQYTYIIILNAYKSQKISILKSTVEKKNS